MTNYSLPFILRSKPTYLSLCAFFNSEKCFTRFSMEIKDGLSSPVLQKKDYDKRSPIHYACAGGNLNIIRMLYDAEYDLNAQDVDGLLPSHFSAITGTVDSMKYLFMKGGNIFGSNQIPITPFQVACLYGNLEIVKFFCEELDKKDEILNEFIHLRGFDSITPLHLACEGGHDKIVNYILSKKEYAQKQVFEIDSERRTPLIVACQNGFLECVKLLVNFGVLSKSSQSGLIDAASSGYADIVIYLLQQKEVNVKEFNSDNLTALEAAVMNGRLSVVEVLIQNGAAKDMNELEVGNLFLKACGTFNFDVVKYLDSCLNIPYNEKGSIFMRQACKIENEDLVNFLLSKNCNLNDINVKDLNFTTKWTPFMEFLKQKGVDFSHLASNDGVPLIVKSIKKGSLESIKKNISEGMELNKEIIEKYDLINYACQKGKVDLFHFLIKYKPTLVNSTQCFDNLMVKFIKFRENVNKKKIMEFFKIANILLRTYKASPNNKENISIIFSKCFVDILELLLKYGAIVNNIIIDFDYFRNGDYSSVINLLFNYRCDFNTIFCKNRNQLIVESVISGELKMFYQLISCGTKFDHQLIDQFNLIYAAVKSLNFQLFQTLLSYNPTNIDATSYLQQIYTDSNNYLLFGDYKFNKQTENLESAYKISEILLSNFNANPNIESVIQFAASNGLANVILLLGKYGADFNNCQLDYSKMTTKNHLPVFYALEQNGCLFQKAKQIDHSYFTQKRNNLQIDSPIKVNLQYADTFQYDYRTFLFLLKYTNNEEIINLRIDHMMSLFSFRLQNDNSNIKEKNVIDILLLIRCYDGILQVYKKLNQIIFPLLITVDNFKEIINKCDIQDLKDMVL